MEVRTYATLVLRWWWLLLTGVVVAGGVSYYVSQVQQPIYRAFVTLLVDQAQDTRGPSYSDVLTSERLTRTYGELIRKTPALEATIEKLDLPYQPEQLERLIGAQVIRDTQLLEVSVDQNDPAWARDIANTLAEVFISQRREEQLGQMSSSRGVLRQQIAELEKQIKDVSQSLDAAKVARNPDSPEIGRLQNSLTQLQSTYSQMLKDETDMRLAEAKALNSIKLAEPARTPSAAVSPKVLLNTLLAAVVGLLLALGAAFLFEFVDDTVKSGAVSERATNLSTLGVVPRIPSSKRAAEGPRLLAESTARSSLGESYRILRANVDFAWAGQPGKIIVFTSANPREGKSTTLSNLALVISGDNRKVIMVDADLRRPSLHRAFGLEGQRGLTNALADPSARVGECLLSTHVPNLWLLPSGPVPPNPSELLGSVRLPAILHELKQLADVVLIDAPPLLAVADPALLAARADGVILVVESGRTRVQHLVRANEVLARTSVRVLGVVLNKISRRTGEHYYQYYHRYYAAAPGSPNGAKKRPSVLSAERFLGRN